MAKKEINHPSGYGLVEVLAGLLIVSFALLLLTKAIFFSFHSYRNSRLKFELHQMLSFYQNQLMAQSFDHQSLRQGGHEAVDHGAVVKWQITDRSHDLKAIRLRVEMKKQVRKHLFYKSRFIKGVNHE